MEKKKNHISRFDCFFFFDIVKAHLRAHTITLYLSRDMKLVVIKKVADAFRGKKRLLVRFSKRFQGISVHITARVAVT